MDKNARVLTENLLLELGAAPNLWGFHFLVDAVEYSINHPGAEHDLCRVLYPAVAAKYPASKGEGWKRVERAIRRLSDSLWEHGNWNKLKEVFGQVYSPITGKATNSQLISVLVLRVKNEIGGNNASL